MQLSESFSSLVQQQLSSFQDEAGLQQLVVYIAHSIDGEDPSLEAIGFWPNISNALPSVEADIELRTPSPNRRWYPLQEGQILLGVLRAERFPSSDNWSNSLDNRLQATASALTRCLSLELDRRRILDELVEQQEQIRLMVHQLRNPLAALRTYAKLLLRKLEPDSKHRNLVEGVLTEQEQLDNYISALDEIRNAKLTPAQNIQSPLLLPPVLSNSRVLTVRTLLEPLINRSSATASLQGRKWHPPVEWPSWTSEGKTSEFGVIAEIIANLLENAFRYSAEGSSIGLYINQSGICVWDNGDEILKSDQDIIFKKGVRGGNATIPHGSGLGLALGRQFSEQLGGKLELVTPPSKINAMLPKQGNAFLLTLPIEIKIKEEVL